MDQQASIRRKNIIESFFAWYYKKKTVTT